MSVRNIRLKLAFDGASYHGWQAQQHLRTIQGVLGEAIRKITGEDVTLIGSGRTDAGTHARAFVANFRTSSTIPPAGLMRALNCSLPPDIRIMSSRTVPLGFHARHSARSKIYRYQIYRGPIMPPHLAHEHFHFTLPLDTAMVRRAARYFEGRHDFAGFAAAPRHARRGERAPARDTVRRILHCRVQCAGHRMAVTVEGDGFLHHMVRNMVGTLLEVGRGRMRLKEFRELFHKRDRRLAGRTVPAHGLILIRVRY